MPLRLPSPINLFVVAMIVVCVPAFAAAQSGRRMPKTSATPVAVPLPEPAPTPSQPKPPVKPEFTIKVFSDVRRINTMALSMPERIPAWVVERMRTSRLLDVRGIGEASRGEAIKKAKAETEAYVVLLELHDDPFASMGSRSVRSLGVVVTIYHPSSGKVKFSRTIPVGQTSSRTTTVLQTCNPGVYGSDLLVLEASLEAADTVLSSFNLPIPPICRSGI